MPTDSVNDVAQEMAFALLARLPALRDLTALSDAVRVARQSRGGLEFEFQELVPLETLERAYVLFVLDRLGGNKTAAADVLQIDPATLYRKLRKWEVE